MIKQLIKLANHLDSKGLRKEADYLDAVIKIAVDAEEDKDEDKAGDWDTDADWDPDNYRESGMTKAEWISYYSSPDYDKNVRYKNKDM